MVVNTENATLHKYIEQNGSVFRAILTLICQGRWHIRGAGGGVRGRNNVDAGLIYKALKIK